MRKYLIKVIPYGKREIEVVEGGLVEEGSRMKNGTCDHIMTAVAAVTVMVP